MAINVEKEQLSKIASLGNASASPSQYPLVSIILATYNERENILDTIENVFHYVAFPVEVIVVDDDSPDETWRLVEQFGDARVKLIRRVHTHGLASAFNRGIIESRGDIVGWMDADMCMPPSLLPTMIEKLKEYDIVIGSRYVKGGKIVGWEMSRRIISRFVNIYANLLTGMPICDITAGFQCARVELLNKIEFQKLGSAGYAFQVELKYYCVKNLGARSFEIPITFPPRRHGEPKITSGIVIEGFFSPLKLFFKRFSSFFGSF